MEQDKEMYKILELGMGELQSICDQKLNSGKSGDLQALENELTHLATLASRYAIYVSLRHGCGCGDQGHDSAYKESEKVYKAVRKKLGFTYP